MNGYNLAEFSFVDSNGTKYNIYFNNNGFCEIYNSTFNVWKLWLKSSHLSNLRKSFEFYNSEYIAKLYLSSPFCKGYIDNDKLFSLEVKEFIGRLIKLNAFL